MKLSRTILAVLFSATAFLALSACSTLSTPGDIRSASRQSLPELPDTWLVAGAQPGEVQIGWIDHLGDPLLSGYVRQAQLANPDIQSAAASLEASYAAARQSRADLFPGVDFSASATESDLFDTPSTGGESSSVLSQSSWDFSLQASWEADLWGRVRAGRNAAYANARAVEADFKFAQHSLAAAVASAYFAIIEAELLLQVSQANFESYAETDRLVRVRAREGYADAQDVRTSASDLASVRESLESAIVAKRSAVRSLEILLGRYPGNLAKGASEFPTTPPSPPAGLPSQLLERRPDLIAAEYEVASAFGLLDQARAARLPIVNLTASIGGSSNELNDLLDGRNLVWSLIGSVLQPVFDGGRRNAQVDEADANQRAAIAAYESAALTAFNEVEDGIDQLEAFRLREDQLRRSRDEAVEAVRLARLRYKEGETDLIDVLSIQQRQFTADQSYVAIRRARLEQWIALNLALGGSWELADIGA